jgi:hypothetical protein
MRGRTVIVVAGFGLLGACSVAACSGTQKTDPTALTLDEYEKNSKENEKPPPDPMANPDESAVDECAQECMSDKDCCEGYYCGKDPEQSARKDYCLPAE